MKIHQTQVCSIFEQTCCAIYQYIVIDTPKEWVFFGEVRRDFEAIAKQVSKSKHRSVGCIGTGEILEIAQMVFQSHNVKIRFVVDVLGHDGNQHYKDLSDVPSALMDETDYLVITESERPHKAFEIVSTGKCKTSILPPAFMKIMPKSVLNQGVR